MILHFMENGDDESPKFSDKEKRILRWVWAVIIAICMSLLGVKMGKGSRFFELVVFNWAYYFDLFFSWILVGCVMEYIYGMTAYLDVRQPWKDGYYGRMFIQMITAIVGGFLFMEAYDEVYERITNRQLVRMNYRLFQIPFSLIVPLVYSFFCCIESLKDAYFELLTKKEEEVIGGDKEEETIVEENPVIAIRDGEDIRLLDIPVKLIWHSEGINKIYYGVGEFYEDNHTLTVLYSCLDKKVYRKAGRNAVVHRDIISGTKPRPDKGVILELAEGYTQQIVVSKNDADDFLLWFKSKEK